MLRVGLTGGIASGKTTVAAMLRFHGCDVLAADALGHELLEAGNSTYEEVVRQFGRDIVAQDGAVDRQKLGEVVFNDAAKLVRLNQILHPPILEIVSKWFAALDRPGGPEMAFVEAALIIEAGWHKKLDRVVVCWCRPEQQLERLAQRKLTPEQAQKRIAPQMPIEEKRRLADDVIDCSGTLEHTAQQVAELVEKLKKIAVAGSKA